MLLARLHALLARVDRPYRWLLVFPILAASAAAHAVGIPAAAIATGGAHSCALTASGGVKCWGWNYSGQLGDNSTTDRPAPTDVTGLTSGVTAIAAGGVHSCALTTGGGVKCWGDNYYGQLGDNSVTNRLTPVDVAGLSSGVVAIAAGDSHSCALTASGGVKCWGHNYYGQLGDNSVTDHLTPVDVTGLSNGVIAIAAGAVHSCALTASGGVKCWGSNNSGQLGDNSTTWRRTPVDVTGLTSGVAAIATGSSHSCALTASGGVKCWGRNSDGQLGDNSTTQRLTPVDVAGLSSGVTAIAAGSVHSCALTTSGGVKCWGDNDYGRLGDNSTTNRLTPTDAAGLSSGVIAIAAGRAHSCALTAGGGIKCWGDNDYGQLGNPTQRLAPVNVAGLSSGVAAIAAGGGHSCALTASGGVKCWGDNYYGQQGDNSMTNRLTPVDVAGLSSGVTAIAAGYFHSCALTASGGVKCWGWNYDGQLGNNSTAYRQTPTDVTGLSSGVIAIAAGYSHSCALTTGGGVKCWGSNDYGQLGDNSTTDRPAPVDVTGLSSGVIAIAAGDSHSCALTASGGIKCWGNNSNGQLGDNSTTQRTTPVDVTGLSSGVTAIAAGAGHSCALTASGGIKCWGYNYNGQLGDNSATQRSTPVNVTSLSSGVTAIAAGRGHSCALTASGGVKCWGRNSGGQLGDNSTTQRLTPVDVAGLSSGVAAIAAGSVHSCALTTSGGVKCWGWNRYGQLGNGTGGVQPFPADVSITAPTVPAAPTVGIAVASDILVSVAFTPPADNGGAGIDNYRATCASQSATGSGSPIVVSNLSNGVAVTCTVAAHNSVGWGAESAASGSVTPANAIPATVIAAGESHSCALTTGGGVKCWGRNYSGQLGDNSTTDRLTPIDVTGLSSGVIAIAAGNDHSCALTASGGVKCWGRNSGGQLGDNSRTNRLTPVDVTGLSSGVIAIAAGRAHSCALTASGGVKCWGDNTFGQLGDNSTARSLTPVDVTSLSSGVIAIAAGYYHSCALTASGGVKCWGDNSNGQLGDNSTTQRLTPVDVTGLSSGVIAIAAGNGHNCALTASGGVKCWGYNGNGQLGDNSTTDRRTPVDVTGLSSGVAAIAAGVYHSCALTTSGGVKCWGENPFGQLGDNSTTRRLTPVDVTGLSSGVTAIAAGRYHSCALTASGGVKCWGQNIFGQLGDNSATDRLTAVDVIGLIPNAVPAAPANVAATAGNAQVTVAFTLPADNGGASIDNYRATCASQSATGSSSPITVSGLSNGVAVTCTVAAHNSAGWGAESAPSASVTPTAPINGICGSAASQATRTAPATGLCAAGTAGSVSASASSFTWTCAGSNGGSNASCSAPRSYLVTPLAGDNGRLDPGTAQTVAVNGTAGFTAIANGGYVVQSIDGCNGTRNGAAFTTGAIVADCTVSATFAAIDTTPDPFAFTPQSGVTRNAAVISNAIVIGGINVAVPVAVTGGSYSLDGGAFTSAPGTANNGQSVRVQLVASPAFSASTTAMLSIGGGSGNFTVTTHNGSSPAPFGFTTVRNAARSTLYESNTVALADLSDPRSIAVTGGEMSINGAAYGNAPATVVTGDTVRVRLLSSPQPGHRTRATVSVGSTSASFDVVTRGAGLSPGALQLLFD